MRLRTFLNTKGKGFAPFWLEREGVSGLMLAASKRLSCTSALT